MNIANWSDLASKEQQFSVSFKHLAMSIETRFPVYKSAADKLELQSIEFLPLLAEHGSILVILCLALSGLFIFFSSFISIHTRNALAMIPTATRIPTASAFVLTYNTIHSFLLNSTLVQSLRALTSEINYETVLLTTTHMHYISSVC